MTAGYHSKCYRNHFQVTYSPVCLTITVSSDYRERGKELFYRILADFADLHPVWVRVQLESAAEPRLFEVSIRGYDVTFEANDKGIIDQTALYRKLREICKSFCPIISLV
ncbi:hypothetical protein BOX15_Mlig010692g1 [Macrostomum lignano]|uniref:Uncharacterized protein n=2 Tax=Macrostomum lignano TaxID=282301 RepID=A0A267E5Z2_9PLAT|nr:hypothetical protein BOX15_Mlig010692g2 [Macrostomum lignano]PAA88626.1 hypothetical protein BOX15_Mlig010692g1 [Macrostomum lignano]